MKRALVCVLVMRLTSFAFGAGEDAFYKLGPDSLVQPGVPQGKLIGPTTLPSNVFPGNYHTYWVYVPAQYNATKPAALMIFNDGQAMINPAGEWGDHTTLRPDVFHKVISIVGSFTNIRGGYVYPEKVLASEKKPLRIFFQDGRNDNRALRGGNYDPTRDWFYQNVRLCNALSQKGLRRELRLGHRPARPEGRRSDSVGYDAPAVARSRGVGGCASCGGEII
jgi:hypothetical protein